jgi:serine/threonine-protein kinase
MQPRPFGPYQLVERLGEGGMAEVFKAKAFGASGFETWTVIKRLLPERAGDPQYEKMFIEEARLHARLRHRNLVQALELGVVDGAYYVRLELVDGADLATLGGSTSMPEPLALFVGEELALALDYVHRATDDAGRPLGLVHRDVSPSNVLLSREGEVKLADFGIAKATLLREQTRSGVRKGKYAYMSFEQANGQALTARSDQFALAVTLAELISGRRPFDDEQRDGPPKLDGIGDDLREVLSKALSVNPGDRFESSEAMRRAIAQLRMKRDPVSLPELGSWVRQRQAV